MSQRVLIVDDSKSMRKMIRFTLEEAGFEVEEAEDGVKGKEALESFSPKVILTDINMPNMDGIELINTVRNNKKFRFTPIVVITTESEKEKQEKGKEAGATAWLVKPFTPDELQQTMKLVAG